MQATTSGLTFPETSTTFGPNIIKATKAAPPSNFPIIPSGHHIIVKLLPFEEKAKDSLIFKPQTRVADEQVAMPLAQVVAMGATAYADPKRFDAPWCAVGDTIFINPYQGSRMSIDGDDNYRMINDDSVYGVVTDPSRVGRG